MEDEQKKVLKLRKKNNSKNTGKEMWEIWGIFRDCDRETRFISARINFLRKNVIDFLINLLWIEQSK